MTMGSLFYGNAIEPISIPDRLLAHIKVVVATKLRRGESFTLTWRHVDGSGRSTIWVQPSIPLRFTFSSPEAEKLDSALLKRFADAASSSAGLTVSLDDDAVELAHAA
jgi:integrase